MRVLLCLSFLLGCTRSEHRLHTVPDVASDDAWTPVPDLGDGSAHAAWTTTRPPRPEPSAPDHPPERVEEHAVGHAPTPVVDYLFVIDDSVSMRKVLRRFRWGMARLDRPGVFPNNARLAVLNTTPADPHDPTRAHPATDRHSLAELLPGFVRLVDADGIADVQASAPDKMAARFEVDGCEAWFSPGDRNADGEPCLRAHSQIGLVHSKAEAGLVALAGWMHEADAAQRPQFREGAAVNIIFVSDTHDPGLPPDKRHTRAAEALLAEQPDFAELASLVNVPVASFRVHAIVPAEPCAEAWEDPSYARVVAASGGVLADICSLRDYSPVIASIAETGAHAQAPVVRLGADAEEVLGVTLDGEAVDWHREGRAVWLPDARPGALRVHYRPAAPVF